MDNSDWVGSSRPGGFGSLNFDGGNDFVEVFDGRISNSLQGTVVAQVRLDAIFSGNDNERIFAYGGGLAGNEGQFSLEVRRRDATATATRVSVIQRSDGDTANFVLGNTDLAVATPYMLAVTSDGAVWKLFLNGIDEGTLNVGGGVNNGNWLGDTTVTEPDKTYIGAIRLDGVDNRFFDGLIDEVRLYNRPLSAAEILQLYQLSQQGYPGVLNRIPRRFVAAAGITVGEIMAAMQQPVTQMGQVQQAVPI